MMKTEMPKEAGNRSINLQDAPPAYASTPIQPSSAVILPSGSQATQVSSSSSSSSYQSRPHASHHLPEEQAKQSIARFGSPYATNAEWSPSEQDTRLRKLPSLAFTMRLQQRFARKAGDIFTPPCPSLSRPVPTITEDYFESVQCKGKGDLASDGFKSIFMGAIMTQRNVSSADWFRFLQDLNVASRLSGAQEALAGITPVTKHLMLPGILVTKLIRYSIVRKREPLIFETVEEWNARFFAIRGLDVFIHNGIERLTATTVGGVIPPLEAKYWNNNSKAPQMTEPYSNSTSSDSSDSEPDDDEEVQMSIKQGKRADRDARRQMRRERRQERRRQRGERRMQRSNGNNSDDNKKLMMLVIAHRSRASEPGPATLSQAVLSQEQQLPSYTHPSQSTAHVMKSEKN